MLGVIHKCSTYLIWCYLWTLYSIDVYHSFFSLTKPTRYFQYFIWISIVFLSIKMIELLMFHHNFCLPIFVQFLRMHSWMTPCRLRETTYITTTKGGTHAPNLIPKKVCWHFLFLYNHIYLIKVFKDELQNWYSQFLKMGKYITLNVYGFINIFILYSS